MHDIGRLLIFAGIFLCVAGAAVLLFARLGIPLGRLPGDMNWQGRNWRVSFPLMTSLLLSAGLSLLMYLLSRLKR